MRCQTSEVRRHTPSQDFTEQSLSAKLRLPLEVIKQAKQIFHRKTWVLLVLVIHLFLRYWTKLMKLGLCPEMSQLAETLALAVVVAATEYRYKYHLPRCFPIVFLGVAFCLVFYVRQRWSNKLSGLFSPQAADCFKHHVPWLVGPFLDSSVFLSLVLILEFFCNDWNLWSM